MYISISKMIIDKNSILSTFCNKRQFLLIITKVVSITRFNITIFLIIITDIEKSLRIKKLQNYINIFNYKRLLLDFKFIVCTRT